MADIGEEQLREAINAIVKDNDLDGLTARKVRRQLGEQFDTDFTERKAEIDDMLLEAIAEKNESQEDSDDERNGQNGNASDSSDSDEDISDKPPPKKKAKPAKKPAAKPKSKANSKIKTTERVISSGDEDEKDVDDAELARKLQEEENHGRGTRHRSAKKVKKQVKSDKPKKPRKAGTSTYSRPCDLTPELAEVVGSDKMARKDVVKTMWDIVKERNLQDPSNRQFMICDDQLYKIFGKKRIKTFGMMKYLKNHIISPS